MGFFYWNQLSLLKVGENEKSQSIDRRRCGILIFNTPYQNLTKSTKYQTHTSIQFPYFY